MRRAGLFFPLVLVCCVRGGEGAQDRGAAAPLFMPSRDVDGLLVAQRRASPRDPRSAYLLALLRELRGRPRDALDMAVLTLRLASSSNDPLAADIAEAAAYLIEDLDDVAPGYSDVVVREAREVLDRPARIGPEAVHVLSELLIRLGQRRGDDELAAFGVLRSGCATRFWIIGPYGPFQLLGFDESLDPEHPGSPPAASDLGPGRGRHAARQVQARGCAANVGGFFPQGGSFFATTFVDLAEPTDVTVRVESPNALKLLVNDRIVLTRDSRQEPNGRIDIVGLRLPSGRSKLTVKLTTRHPNPVLLLSLLDARTLRPVGRPTVENPEAPYRPSAELIAARPGSETASRQASAFERILLAARSLARGDVVLAREAIGPLAAPRQAPALALALAGVTALQDPALPEDARRDRARRFFRRALARDENLWIATYQLARLEMADDRPQRAIELLQAGGRRHPRQLEFPLLLSDLYASEGWEAEAMGEVARARTIDPDACRPLHAELALFRRANSSGDVERVTAQASACDRSSEAAASGHVQARRWRDAEREIRRLWAFEPDSVGLETLLSDVMRGSGELGASAEILASLLARRPGSPDAVLRRSDLATALSDPAAAGADLEAALALRPAEMAELRRPLAVLEGTSPMQAYRLDGAEIIERYLTSGRSYEAPAVLVLDYTVVRVWSDGSSLELTHNIVRVQSPEGIERYGEFQPPERSELLTLRTVKADGTRLEPEELAGKESLSFPNLAPGDFVEYEYIAAHDPPASFPGGYYGERFYFRSFDTPFDRSELHVVAPRSMRLSVDPRGQAPSPQVADLGPLRMWSFRAAQMHPVVAEPHASSSREFLPSVQVSTGAPWSSLVASMLDALADRMRDDPEIHRVAARVAGPAAALPAVQRAKRLYHWVIREIRDGADLFEQASEIIISRNGSRPRALHALLRAAGIEAQLALVRDAAADRTQTEVASPDAYEHPVVRVDLPDGPLWISTFDEGAPFGYLPPSLRGQPALGLVRGGPVWRTSEAPDGSDRRDVELALEIDREGRGQADAVERFRGAAAVAWRKILRQIPAAELRQKFEQLYLGRIVEGAELRDLDVEGALDPEALLVIRYRWRAPAIARRDGDGLALRALYATLLSPDLARSPLRSSPLVVDEIVDMHLQARITLPQGLTLGEGAPYARLSGAFGRFRSRVYSTQPGQARIERSLLVIPARISPDRYPAFATFCRAIDQAQLGDIPLQRGQIQQ